MLLKTIAYTNTNSWNPFCHARTKNFYFNYQKGDGKGIVISKMKNEFTTLFTSVNSAARSPSVKNVPYLGLIR